MTFAEIIDLIIIFMPMIHNSTYLFNQQIWIPRLRHCVELMPVLNDIVFSMHGNMLKLNAVKTEIILFTSKRNSKLVSDISVNVGVS